MYLTYDEYREMGGSVTEAAFSRWEYKARKRIEEATFRRLDGVTEVPEAVRRLMFELIALAEEEARGGAVSYVSNDGYSETYSVTGTEERTGSLIASYLAGEKTADGVPLLYCGVRT